MRRMHILHSTLKTITRRTTSSSLVWTGCTSGAVATTQTVRIVGLALLIVTAPLLFSLLVYHTQPVISGQSTNSLSVAVKTDKSSYAIDEKVRITLTVSNTSPENFSMTFPTPCAIASFIVRDPWGTTLYYRNSHVICNLVLVNFTLGPGQSYAFNFTWDQLDDKGVHVFAPNDYNIQGFLLIPNWARATLSQSPIGQAQFSIQSRAAGDGNHSGVNENLPTELVPFASWTFLAICVTMFSLHSFWTRRGIGTISSKGRKELHEQRYVPSSAPYPSIWLILVGGGLTLLNGLFFYNFGFLLQSSNLSVADYTPQVIFTGLTASITGVFIVSLGILLSIRSRSRMITGAIIALVSLFDSLASFYYANSFSQYATYPFALYLGNMISIVGGILTLSPSFSSIISHLRPKSSFGRSSQSA
ncbi:hypothetical protein J2P12_06255 [Candidatus Bathyarchaeota archaeon]|nr:hypothetical protein [Candidatus Bathyarchaeota archaeon]